jgi:DNA-binding FrmR family transcriptional regulator
MRDETRVDLDRRLACVRGHLQATLRMIERGEGDLAVVHQLQAVRGALTQIQIRLLRVWLSECSDRMQQPDTVRQIKRELSAILKIQKGNTPS